MTNMSCSLRLQLVVVSRTGESLLLKEDKDNMREENKQAAAVSFPSSRCQCRSLLVLFMWRTNWVWLTHRSHLDLEFTHFDLSFFRPSLNLSALLLLSSPPPCLTSAFPSFCFPLFLLSSILSILLSQPLPASVSHPASSSDIFSPLYFLKLSLPLSTSSLSSSLLCGCWLCW